MFVTDTLASPYVEQEWLPSMYAPIAESRKQAGKIKLQEPIMVVIGNPFGLERTLTTGIISSLGRTIETQNGRRVEDI